MILHQGMELWSPKDQTERKIKMELKGTQTEKNLLTAFAGESQARNRYTYAASKAKKDGFVQISDIFTETANQEKEHAKRLFKFLEGGEVEIAAAFPAGIIGTTAENLKAAAGGEHEEWSEMYPAFAVTAREENLPVIAMVFESIAIAAKGKRKLGRAMHNSGSFSINIAGNLNQWLEWSS